MTPRPRTSNLGLGDFNFLRATLFAHQCFLDDFFFAPVRFKKSSQICCSSAVGCSGPTGTRESRRMVQPSGELMPIHAMNTGVPLGRCPVKLRTGYFLPQLDLLLLAFFKSRLSMFALRSFSMVNLLLPGYCATWLLR